MTEMKVDSAPDLNIEVAFALPDKQKIIALCVPQGTTAKEAVGLSNIADDFPDEDIANAHLGIFGQSLGTKGLAAAEQYRVQEGDRVEIYRPLIADPKAVRRKRAEKAKAQKEEKT